MRKHKVHSSVGLLLTFLLSVLMLGLFVYLLTDTFDETSTAAPQGINKLKEIRQDLDTPPPVAP